MSEPNYTIPESDRKLCTCKLCERGRFFRRISELLPEADANDFWDVIHAMWDEDNEKDLRIAQLTGVIGPAKSAASPQKETAK